MRLAVLSNERLDPWVNWTTLGPPLLNRLASFPDARFIAPPSLRWRHRAELRDLVAEYRQSECVFWMQGSSHPEGPVWALTATKPFIRRSAFVVDAWRQSLGKIGTLAVAQRLNPCFVAYREAWEELSGRFPSGKFEWLPFGVDTGVFRPRPVERDIFAYWMGRRFEPLHRALLKYCAERDLPYHYTRVGGEIKDPDELGTLVARCRYFVVTPPDLDNPRRTGGFSPLVMRYLEGVAGGARLLGVLPKSGEFEAVLPREAICVVEPDGSDLAEKIDADLCNEGAWSGLAALSERVRSEHSWARRADQICERLAAR